MMLRTAMCALTLAGALHVQLAPAQPYPAKSIRILVGFAPGGGTDIMARAVAAKMTASMKQQVIVENRPGANANIAAKLAAVLPDVPTIAESGVPGYAMSTWYGAVAPAKTPREIVVRLNQEILKALALPDVKERLASLGADIVATSPDATSAFFKTEVAKYTKVAKAANIRAD